MTSARKPHVLAFVISGGAARTKHPADQEARYLCQREHPDAVSRSLRVSSHFGNHGLWPHSTIA